MNRIDMVEVTIVVTSFDDEGRITEQRRAQPIVVYRAKTPDVWEFVDSLLKEK